MADAREDKCKKISAQLSKYNFYFLQEMMQGYTDVDFL